MPKIASIKPVPERVAPKLMPQEKERLKKACKEFESILISYMFKSMQDTIQKSGLFDESETSPENMFRSMFNAEVAKEMCTKNNLGLAELLYKQLTER